MAGHVSMRAASVVAVFRFFDMSASPQPSIFDPLPENVVRVRIKGTFKLNREPHGQIQGWDFFHMNASTVDWAPAADTARRQLHGDTPTPESDRRYEQVLRERAERELAEKQAKAAA